MSHLHGCHMIDNFWQIFGTDFHRKLICNAFLSLPLDNGLILKTFCGGNGRGIVGLDKVAIAWLVRSHVDGGVVSHGGWYVVDVKGRKVLEEGSRLSWFK